MGVQLINKIRIGLESITNIPKPHLDYDALVDLVIRYESFSDDRAIKLIKEQHDKITITGYRKIKKTIKLDRKHKKTLVLTHNDRIRKLKDARYYLRIQHAKETNQDVRKNLFDYINRTDNYISELEMRTPQVQCVVDELHC